MRISSINIKNFKGIPNELNIDFVPGGQIKPQSLIIFGDNGTGKSSIVNAFEFALQGKIQGKGNLFKAISYGANTTPSVTVSFSDNSTFERSIIVEKEDACEDGDDSEAKGKLIYNHNLTHPNFRVSPFILRRADILQFLSMPAIKRQIVFMDYLNVSEKPESEPALTEKEEILVEKRVKEKAHRRDLLEKLSKELGVDKEIPPAGPEFEEFIIKHIYKGHTKKAIKKLTAKGALVKYNFKAEKLAKKIRESSLKISRLNKEIKKATMPPSESEYVKKAKNVLKKIFINIERMLTNSFINISTCDFVEKIEIVPGAISDMSLSLKVKLKNGIEVEPQDIFSCTSQNLS